MLEKYTKILKNKNKELEKLLNKKNVLKDGEINITLEIDIVCLQQEVNILELFVMDLKRNKGSII